MTAAEFTATWLSEYDATSSSGATSLGNGGRGAKGAGEASESGRQCGEEQQEDQVMVVQAGVEGQSDAGQREHDGTEQHQDALVGAVTHGATPQRAGDEKRQLDETGESHPQAGVRLAVDLKGYGDDGQVTTK